MEMDFNHYYRDFMGIYGYENRKWKMDGPKLIRYSEKGEELYFYDLPDFNQPGLRAWYKGLKGFNLVNNKVVVKLSLRQRWKLYKLIEDKFNDIQRLNKVKGQMVSVGKTLGKGLVRPIKNVIDLIGDRDQKSYDVTDTWRERQAPPSPITKRSVYLHKMEQTLKEKLEVQKKLEERGDYMERMSFDDKLKMRVKAMMDKSISKENIIKTRQEKIEDRITNLSNRFNND